ncbi:hypothetical protein [Actinoplanes couchii]|uniref:ESX-1 secretion-associated protein EspA/EspE-like domain-containing protein n=1 Tax=Actinoplanes couchii TaxID=403638 RepID=A0ABQ3X6L8_9ACTN|nr:hypothetical protein [Actinoplanes couchii]MDR6325263.1 hypothetical protein [Actinoplanes couchii]GID54033.1 hypothetical protein Aco03nite_024370 [Actinoplanes couchii]
MSYDELRQHALRIEELAMKAALDEKGIVLIDGQYIQERNPVPPEIITFLRADFVGLAELFEPFLTLPDPEALDAMRARLQTAAESMATGSGCFDPSRKTVIPPNSEMTGMGTVAKTVFDWQGFAARNFEELYIEKWDGVVSAQFHLVTALMAAIDAERSLWTECRKDVDEIAHNAINALVSMNSFDQDQQVFWLSVAGAVLSIASVTTTGGASVAFAVAGAATQVAGTGLDKFGGPDSAVVFDAKTPRALVDQLKSALFQLTHLVMVKENEITNAMLVTSETVANFPASFSFPRPALADQTSRGILTSEGIGDNA